MVGQAGLLQVGNETDGVVYIPKSPGFEKMHNIHVTFCQENVGISF